MHREKFPEKIPFRLTRMLINAMEVSGIEGTFRITCENVMRVIRENKESLMAVLEAFLYDPLINWRLLNAVSPKGEVKTPLNPTLPIPAGPRKMKTEAEIIVSGNFAIFYCNR
jgi:FKBP12-rapamycin complex-associated protein